METNEPRPEAADMKSWMQALEEPAVCGPMYSLRDECWYLDARASGGVIRSTRVFGEISQAMDEFDRVLIPQEVIDTLGIVKPVPKVPRYEERSIDIERFDFGGWRSEAPKPSELNFDKLIAGEVNVLIAVCVDAQTNEVLMTGCMNQLAYEWTIVAGVAVFWSRTREELWMKGETSGNFLEVERIVADCDSDTVKLYVNPMGPVCHTGADTCFD